MSFLVSLTGYATADFLIGRHEARQTWSFSTRSMGKTWLCITTKNAGAKRRTAKMLSVSSARPPVQTKRRHAR